MSEELYSHGRRWHTGDMELPLGRGVNFMWEVSDTESLYQRVKELSADSISLHWENASYECGGRTITQK
jgi:hypothetical protein